MNTYTSIRRLALACVSAFTLVACGGGGGGSDDPVPLGITSLEASSGTVMQLEGAQIPFVVNVHNPEATVFEGVVQFSVRQGTAVRAAGGTVVSLPRGDSAVHWSSGARNGSSGHGTLVAGPAFLDVELNDSEGALVDVESLAITLE